MKELVLKLKREFIFDYEEADIESDKKLFEKYKEKIPVLFLDGKLFAKYRIDEAKLRKKLSSVI